MIEVTVTHSSGLRDAAEADTPEDAVFAGRTLFDEACDVSPDQGFRRSLRVQFLVDGQSVWAWVGTRP